MTLLETTFIIMNGFFPHARKKIRADGRDNFYFLAGSRKPVVRIYRLYGPPSHRIRTIRKTTQIMCTTMSATLRTVC